MGIPSYYPNFLFCSELAYREFGNRKAKFRNLAEKILFTIAQLGSEYFVDNQIVQAVG
jgi:hypothetical protein